MKSAGNGGVVQSRLQVLHVHVFLAAPLGARHVAQPRSDQPCYGAAKQRHDVPAGRGIDGNQQKHFDKSKEKAELGTIFSQNFRYIRAIARCELLRLQYLIVT